MITYSFSYGKGPLGTWSHVIDDAIILAVHYAKFAGGLERIYHVEAPVTTKTTIGDIKVVHKAELGTENCRRIIVYGEVARG